jgi:hypothetical protein
MLLIIILYIFFFSGMVQQYTILRLIVILVPIMEFVVGTHHNLILLTLYITKRKTI